MATRIIGIDFGTSTTVVRIHNVGTGNSIIPLLINGQSVIPTIAFKPEESEDLYYGYDAQAKIDMLTQSSQNTIANINELTAKIDKVLKSNYISHSKLANDQLIYHL